jgi:hypothetical protein
MGNPKPITGPEALQISVRVSCLCQPAWEQMQIVRATADNGSHVSESCFECPKCHRHVAVELLIGTRYGRTLA